MELFKLIHGMLDMSGLDWHLGIGSDGTISGYVDDIDFYFNPELLTSDRFIADLAQVIIQAQVDGDGDEEE
ncbi:hypothetical protein NQU17_02385 [Clostridiaceae bacterium HFYG-1003]|nr:hypothetical protein NQU17_02385 [Clostridiaceae bacterium HFYG-1003]